MVDRIIIAIVGGRSDFHSESSRSVIAPTSPRARFPEKMCFGRSSTTWPRIGVGREVIPSDFVTCSSDASGF